MARPEGLADADVGRGSYRLTVREASSLIDTLKN